MAITASQIGITSARYTLSSPPANWHNALVYRLPGGPGSGQTPVLLASGVGDGYTAVDSGLEGGGTYAYQVIWRNSSNAVLRTDNSATFLTFPWAPAAVNAYGGISGATATVSWDNVGQTGTWVFRSDGTLVATVGAGTYSWSESLNPGETRYYYVRPYNSNSTGTTNGPDSNTVGIFYNRAPNAPDQMSPANGAAVGATQVSLSARFTDPDGQNGHIHWRIGTSNGAANVYDQASSQQGSGHLHQISIALQPDTTYWWQPVAVDASGAQTWGESRSFLTDRTPAAPTNVGPSGATGSNSVTLSATVTDPDGQNSYANFQLATDAAFTQNVTNYDGTTVASGQVSTQALNVTPNTQYYVRARTVSNGRIGPYSAGVAFTSNRPPTQPGAITAPAAAAVVNTTATITWGASTDPDSQPVQYWIDLSLDNGVTWSRILNNLTGTSTTYDFSNTAATTAARLRVFAGQNPDVGQYSSMRESSNFTIQHNQAPLAPTQGAPSDNTTLDRSVVQRFVHTFNDPDAGDTQSKVDFEYRLVGAPTWTVISVTTTNQFVDVPAGTFAVGNYERRTRTYDALGAVSPYSAIGYFSAANVPAAPTITTPANNATISTAAGTVAWSYPSQQAYEFRRVADNAGSPNTATVYESSGTVTSVTARNRAVTYADNNRYEHVQVRVQDANGLWTAWASARVLVSYTAPAIPALVVSAVEPNLHVQVTQPKPNMVDSDAASSFEDGTTGGYGADTGAPTLSNVTGDTGAGHGGKFLRATAPATVPAGVKDIGFRRLGITQPLVVGKRYALSYVIRRSGTAQVRTSTVDLAGAVSATGLGAYAMTVAFARRTIFFTATSAAALNVYWHNVSTNDVVVGAQVDIDAVTVYEVTDDVAEAYYLPSTPAVSATHIYRREIAKPTTTEVRLATSIPSNGLYVDRTPAALVPYEYKAVAIGVNSTQTESAWTP